jgi:hypothetical protein
MALSNFQSSCLAKLISNLARWGSLVSFFAPIIISMIVSFKVSAIVGLALAWFSLCMAVLNSQYVEPGAKPKILDVVAPIMNTILLPLTIVSGEDFSKYWLPLIPGGILTSSIFIGLMIKRPIIFDYLETDKFAHDDRLEVVWYYVAFWNSVFLGIAFFMQFLSNLIAAIGQFDGTLFTIFGRAIPISISLLLFPVLYRTGPYLFKAEATRVIGEDYLSIMEALYEERNRGETENNVGNNNDPSEPLLGDDENEVEEGNRRDLDD